MELLSISDEKDREAVENILNKYRAERGFIKAPVN
ncbi:transcriptional regulator, partial [Lacticaseibacillus rhamnosus]